MKLAPLTAFIQKRRLALLSVLILGAVAIGTTFLPADNKAEFITPAHAEEKAKPWNVRCEDAEDKKAPKRGRCEMFQRLMVQETNKRFLEFAIAYPAEPINDDKNMARGIIILPLGILVGSGVEIKIDEGETYKGAIRHCMPNGCFAYMNMPAAVLKEFRKGDKAVVSFMNTKPQRMNVELSLSGFSRAIKEISK